MVANLLKNIAAIRAVAIPKYSVCILCHIVCILVKRLAKIGNMAGKNYI